MFPFPSYCGLTTCSTGNGFLQVPVKTPVEMTEDGVSISSSRPTSEAKAVAASKSHSEAERRRRERINGHLATLRTLLPNTTKTDKASLLAEVVQHVKELKRLADDVVAQDGDRSSSGSSSSISSSGEYWSFPGETDELTIDYVDAESRLLRASLCCDDRAALMSDLAQALRSVGARVVKAEMATVGGRTKNVVVLEGGGGGDEDVGILRRALKGVLDNSALSASGQVLSGSKRPRLSRQLIDNDF